MVDTINELEACETDILLYHSVRHKLVKKKTNEFHQRKNNKCPNDLCVKDRKLNLDKIYRLLE